MNLKSLSDNQLIEATNKLVQQEREILTAVLHHLKEIERRRLFSSLGFKSLFDYAVKTLNYSEDQAYRRISAMRLLKEIPELEEKINEGSINLSHLSLAQSFFRSESKFDGPQNKRVGISLRYEEKLNLLKQLENKSTRDAQKVVLSLSSNPQKLIPEKSRQVTEELTELRFTINEELKHKIDRVKGLYAHSNPQISMAELLDKLCDLAIQKKSATFRKRCVTNPVECQNCHSSYALEIDHIIPRAKGGGDSSENLRLLCRSCNQRAAIKEFGLRKMDRFIN